MVNERAYWPHELPLMRQIGVAWSRKGAVEMAKGLTAKDLEKLLVIPTKSFTGKDEVCYSVGIGPLDKE